MELIIKPILDPVAFEIYGFQIRWYGIIMSVSIFIGALFAYKLISNKISKKSADIFLDFSPLLILFSIIGARLFYVIAKWDYYSLNLKEIIMINHGGLSIWGAIIFGMLSFSLIAKLKKLEMVKIFDILAIAMPLCQSVGRFGNYFNQEAYGKPTDLFLKLYVSPIYRKEEYFNFEYFHTTFLYESFLNLALFIVLFFIYLKFPKLKQGIILCLYFIGYSIIRFCIESIRIDSVFNVKTIPIAQIICLVALVISIVCLVKNCIKKGA